MCEGFSVGALPCAQRRQHCTCRHGFCLFTISTPFSQPVPCPRASQLDRYHRYISAAAIDMQHISS